MPLLRMLAAAGLTAWLLAGAAGPASAMAAVSGGAAADGAGLMSVSPATVQAGSPSTLTFTYQAASQILKDGTVTLTVPAGWTPPSAVPGPGYATADCADCGGALAVSGMTLTFARADLESGQSFVITYADATPPDTSANLTFLAQEQSGPAGSLTALASSPAVLVTCPDGTGTMSVSPQEIPAPGPARLTFRYTAAGCGLLPGGIVSLTVPPGWPQPAAAGTAGYPTASDGTVSVADGMISVIGASLAPGQALIIRWPGARTGTGPGAQTGAPGSYSFAARERTARGETMTPLAAPPRVVVIPPVPGGGRGRLTVSPATVVAARRSTLTFAYTAPPGGLADSDVVALTVPPGWTAPSAAAGAPAAVSASAGLVAVTGRQITVTGATIGAGRRLLITYRQGLAPRPAGRTSFPALEGPSAAALAALAASPSVTAATAASGTGSGGNGPNLTWMSWTAVLLLAALIAAAAAGLAFGPRLLRRYWHLAPPSRIAATPHAGRSAAPSVRDTGDQPTLAVRIEPHPGTARTTITQVTR